MLCFVKSLFFSFLILIGGCAISRYKKHASIWHLLQSELIRVYRISVFITHVLKDITVELFITGLHLGSVLVNLVSLLHQFFLLILQVVDVYLYRDQRVDLPLAAVLRSDLVLSTTTDISDQGQLSIVKVVLLKKVIEGIYRQTDDFVDWHWDFERPGALLVAR